jgi:hypothetical protein
MHVQITYSVTSAKRSSLQQYYQFSKSIQPHLSAIIRIFVLQRLIRLLLRVSLTLVC